MSEKQLPGTFSWFSGWTWLSLITSAVAAFSLFLGVTQHLRIKALYLVIATLEKSHALPTELIVNYHVITTPTDETATALGFQQYVTMVAEWLPAELTLILIFLGLVAGVVIYMSYRKCNPSVTGPQLYLEIGTKQTAYRVKIAELRYAVSNYKLTVNQNVVQVEVVQKYLYALLRWSDVLTLQNKLLALPLDLPLEVKILPWRCYTIQALLATNHYIVVQFVSATGKITDVAVLKPWRTDTDRVGCSAGPPLRPDPLPATSAGKC